MGIESYKELVAYKKAYQTVLSVYKVTKKFPKEELYSFTSQLRRSAVSIPSNIAEGYMRGSKEYVQFLKIALGSCAELETQMSLSKDLGYCSKEEFSQIDGVISEIIKLLRTYIRKISKR